MYRQVLEFHRTFGHPVGKEPRWLSPIREEHRRKWQASERHEFKDAREAGDMVAAADAIADEIYFLVGMAVEMGLPMGKIFRAVHHANMRKVWKEGPHAVDCEINTDGNSRCTCGKLRYSDVGRVLKPDGWMGPEQDIMNILAGNK
jgi:predicted HAD superfamily Cof-like phosphohydrolase